MIQTIAPQSGTAFLLRSGSRLKVIDPEGLQVSDLFCFSQADPREYLSSGRSIDYNDKIYLTLGDTLYSNRSSQMLKIIDDTCGRHDFLLTPCSQKMFDMVSGSCKFHPSCHENLLKNLVKFGINEDLISTTFNIFMNVSVDPSGKIKILPPLSKAGDYVVFEAQMDLIVGLTACSHEETNNGKCKSIKFEVMSTFQD